MPADSGVAGFLTHGGPICAWTNGRVATTHDRGRGRFGRGSLPSAWGSGVLPPKKN